MIDENLCKSENINNPEGILSSVFEMMSDIRTYLNNVSSSIDELNNVTDAIFSELTTQLDVYKESVWYE